MQKKASLFELFWTFFKIGAFTFGGGYAMISMIEREVVTNKKWVTHADILDMLVIAESTPGVFAVNMATFCGFRKRKAIGSIIATLGVILPSFLCILAISFALEAVENNKFYKSAFYGIQICVCTLILNAFLRVSKDIEKDFFSFFALICAFGVALFTDFNIIFLILIGGGVGVIISLIKQKFESKTLPQLPQMEENNQINQQPQQNSIDDINQPQNQDKGEQP